MEALIVCGGVLHGRWRRNRRRAGRAYARRSLRQQAGADRSDVEPYGHWLAWADHTAPQTRVVLISQSERMAEELQSAGKKVKFVKLEGEDHWMSRSEDRVRSLKEIDAFLHEHL